MIKKIVFGFVSLLAVVTLLLAAFIIPEGHVGVVKRFGEATHQVEPGLHFKLPFVDTVTEIEVRTRRAMENLASATDEQMPVSATVSVNWTVHRTEAIDLFRQYGGLDQFENRILEPRLRAATKASISKYKAETLIKDREGAPLHVESSLRFPSQCQRKAT